ncbi:hypothetical protein [Paenibacillus naphthalenovorans]|uniref:hypothetical protein n=1 Tax=Paenibacillus naphthalenovorans TaxID=162209 RepID=UPI003D29152C
MTYDSIYWLILGAGCILTGLVGIGSMIKTGKLLWSFLAGTAVNMIITFPSCWWWASVFAGPDHHFSRMFGLFGLLISFVNNEVLLFFAQFVMKKKTGGEPASTKG